MNDTRRDDCLLYDPIKGQGQGHRHPKFAKMADINVYFISSACLSVSVHFKPTGSRLCYTVASVCRRRRRL